MLAVRQIMSDSTHPDSNNAASVADGAPLVEVRDLVRHFDVSPPWLNRVLERKPRQIVKAVDGIGFDIKRGQTFSLVGESGCGK